MTRKPTSSYGYKTAAGRTVERLAASEIALCGYKNCRRAADCKTLGEAAREKRECGYKNTKTTRHA